MTRPTTPRVPQAPKKRCGFPKSAHLLRTADFRRVYSEGRRRSLDWLVVFSLATGQPLSRIGLTVPASLGGAVQRNRIKRRLREAVRANLGELGAGWDLVLHPRATALTLDIAAIEETIQKLFRACARSEGQSS